MQQVLQHRALYYTPATVLCKPDTAVSFLRQYTFAGSHLSLSPRIVICCHAQRPRKRLERGFYDVVRVLALQLAYVQRHARCVDHALEEVLHELCVKRADAL